MSLEFREYYNNIGLQFIKEKPLFGLAIPLTAEEQKPDAAYGEQR